MTFFGFLITLLIGVGIGYFVANMRGAATANQNGEQNRDRNKNQVRQRPVPSHQFAAETGEIGDGQSQQQQGPLKPAYSSAAVFVQHKDQLDRQSASANQCQTTVTVNTANTTQGQGTNATTSGQQQDANQNQDQQTSRSDSQLLQ